MQNNELGIHNEFDQIVQWNFDLRKISKCKLHKALFSYQKYPTYSADLPNQPKYLGYLKKLLIGCP